MLWGLQDELSHGPQRRGEALMPESLYKGNMSRAGIEVGWGWSQGMRSESRQVSDK